MAKQETADSISLQAYKQYLESVNPQGGGKVSCYLQVIRHLGKILNRQKDYAFVPNDFSEIKNLELLSQIYKFLLEEQKKPDGGVFNGSAIAKSYWGDGHAFCSAAVRSFIDYRIKTYDGPIDPKPIPLHEGEVRRDAYQLITYGAPGTGKSHQTCDEVAGHTVFRTTFHPDSDYSTFVGAYKPTMTDDAGETEIWKLTKDGAVQDAVHKVKRGISYSFVAQAFIHAYVAAWKKMGTMDGPQEVEPIFLVIEEINRGNCAQIFGDLFQLLDRNDAGYSEYPIEADADLKRYLGAPEVLGSLDPKKMARHGVPEDIASGVVSGEKLVLPPNFYIRATMNTSDQSLFPMDSAFKRRWDWKYVPIKDVGEGWKIKVDDFERNWWDFLVAINKIVKGVTNSSDKQMGYFFVRAKNKEIDADIFVNKVAFYLWNDVFKDCELDGDAFKITREDGDGVLAFEDFFKEDGTINEDVLKNFLTTLVPTKASTEESSQG